MNGAESLIRTAVAAGVEVCFANPGTTELPLLTAFDAVPGIRAVLGLFEGVCTGAADGYGRMAERPALTLLHLGAGFANGIANLHNARRARSPIVNVIGDHATWHRQADAPLTSDILSLARTVSGWVRTSHSSKELSDDVAAAIAAASRQPGQIASLIAPVNFQEEESPGPAPVRSAEITPPIDVRAIAETAKALSRGQPAALLLGGYGLRARGLRAAARIAAKSGCRLLCDTFPARLERGGGMPRVDRLPYFPDQAMESLSQFSVLVLAGSPEPVAFFGYAGLPSRVTPKGCTPVVLAHPTEDVAATLEALAERLGAPKDPGPYEPDEKPSRPSGKLTPQSLGEAIAAVQPEGTIVIDEGATSGPAYFQASLAAPAHSYLGNTGGAIGLGLPCAIGAALACPERRVVVLQADGSGIYTLQALWSQAREGLNVTTVVCANRSYRILRVELARAGINEPGPKASALTDLTRPVIDWVKLAKSLGVPGARVKTAEDLLTHLERGLTQPGPYLIEALI